MGYHSLNWLSVLLELGDNFFWSFDLADWFWTSSKPIRGSTGSLLSSSLDALHTSLSVWPLFGVFSCSLLISNVSWRPRRVFGRDDETFTSSLSSFRLWDERADEDFSSVFLFFIGVCWTESEDEERFWTGFFGVSSSLSDSSGTRLITLTLRGVP